jgi:hypothetical protein
MRIDPQNIAFGKATSFAAIRLHQAYDIECCQLPEGKGKTEWSATYIWSNHNVLWFIDGSYVWGNDRNPFGLLVIPHKGDTGCITYVVITEDVGGQTSNGHTTERTCIAPCMFVYNTAPALRHRIYDIVLSKCHSLVTPCEQAHPDFDNSSSPH